MLSYDKGDIVKSLKMQRVFGERWQNQNVGKENLYRRDNDIFNTNSGKENKGSEFYKQKGRESSESRITNKLRVKT